MGFRRTIPTALFLLGTLVPAPCLADNMGAMGTALGFLLLGLVATLAFMIAFIVLAKRISRQVESGTIGPSLVRNTRVLAGIWYLLALTPFITTVVSGGYHYGVDLLLGVIGGLPAHIAAAIALARAARLARLRQG